MQTITYADFSLVDPSVLYEGNQHCFTNGVTEIQSRHRVDLPKVTQQTQS